MIAKVFIVCSVLLLSLCGVTSAFNCDNTLYQTYDALRQCLESEPYNSTIKDQTVLSLQMIMPSYVFIDSSLNSADPVHIPMNVNLTAELENVANSNYANDAQLQEAISHVFTLIQDAHTHYLKPRVPYVASSFVMPFVFYSRVEGSPLKQNIYLRWNEQLLTVYTNLYGQSPISNPQNDLLVLSIDGSDPVTNIGTFANNSVGYTKDYSARFNLAIDGYGGDFPAMYTWRNQSLQGMPATELLQLDVQDTVTKVTSNISVSWIGVYDPYFNVSFVEEAGANSLVGVHVFEFLDRAYGIDRYNDFEEPSGNPDVYYTTIAPDVGVLRIYTFSPKNRTEYIKTIEEAMCTFASSGITKLILDLSQNGGGDICLGYAVENFLFPNLAPITGAYDIKASDLFRAFADAGSELLCTDGGTINNTLQFCGTNPELAGYFTPCAWFDWFSKEEYYDETWFVPGNYAVRGGVGAYYSSFVTQGCAPEFTMWIPGQTTGWTLDPSNVIIVSDGLCGSTCAVFSRHLQLKHKVKAVTTGGVYGGQQPSFTSFPGGEVVYLKYIHILAEQYGLTDSPLIPPPLPTDADFRFAIREIFGWDDIALTSVPQEFTYVPADWQIFYQNSFQNHTEIWNQVLGFFDVCASWQTQPCTVANGLGEYRCVNGVLDTADCVITQCNPGYTFDLQENICTPCGYGFYKTGFDLSGCVLCPNILPGNCDYSQDAVTAPSCPFSCTECQECTQTQDDGINSNTVCLQTWAFCLLIVLVVVLSFAISTVVSCLVTRKYYLKKAAQTYAPLNQDFDD